jgi:hypothetical protein
VELREPKGHKEQEDHKGILELKELREHKGRKVTEDHKELKEP